MRKVLSIIGVIFAVLVLVMVVFLFVMSPRFKEQRYVRNLPIDDVDLSQVADGRYAGDFSYGNFTYQVEVAVKEHRIEDIKILKNREESKYAKRAEGIVPRVLKAQSLHVDAVTGATTSSKALLKAMEKALKGGSSK